MSRRLLDYRRMTRLAVLYPLLILVLAGVLITLVVPPLMQALPRSIVCLKRTIIRSASRRFNYWAHLAKYAWLVRQLLSGCC